MAKAELSRIPLAEAIRDLHHRGSTGDLHVRKELGGEKILHFRDGRIVGVSSELESDSIERVVTKWGLLSNAELDGVKSLSEDRPLIQLLQDSGVLAEEEVEDFLQRHEREKALDLFLWSDGEVEFSKGEPSEEGKVISVPELILEGVRRSTSFDAVRERLLWANPVLHLVDEPDISLDELSLHPQEGYLFSVVDGTSTLEQVLTLSPLEDDETIRLLYAFLVLGLLRADHQAEGERFSIRRFGEEEERFAERLEDTVMKLKAINSRISDLDDWAIFGLDEGTGLEEVNRVYQELIEKYRPERFPLDIRKQCRRELELINARIGAAYLSLTERQMGQATAAKGQTTAPDRLRTREQIEADAREAAEAAQEMRKRAKAAEASHDFHTAIQYAELAVRREPDNPDHHAYHAHLLRRNPAWVRRAEAALQRAVELDPENPDYHWELAQLYMKRNYNSKAREELEKVAALDPDREKEIKKLVKRLK